jgi:LysR family transcriptional activator of nhaA
VEIAPVKAVTDQLYAITRSRKVAHEGVRAICSGFD